MGLGRKLISNSFYLFLQWIVTTIIGFIFWLIAGKLLLPAQYGIVSTSFNLASILSGISTLGLGAAIWKLIPEYLVKKQEGKIISLIRFSFKVIIVTNLIILFVFLTATNLISSTTNLPAQAVILTGLMIFLLSLSGQAGTVMYGFQHMKKFLLTDLWGELVRDVSAAVLLFFGFSYIGPILGFIFYFLVTAVLRFLKIPLKGKQERINEKLIMMHYALPALIGLISSTLFLSGQYVLLSALQNTKETGIYSVTTLITTPIVVMSTTLTSALLPITSGLSVNHSTKKQRSRLVELVFRYTLFLSLPIALFLIVFSKQVILIFSRPEYLPASQLFPILAISSLIYGLGNLFLSNLYAIGKTKTNRNITIAISMIFFFSAIPLIKLFSSFGLAVSYSITAVTLCLISYIYIRRYVKIKLSWLDSFRLVVAGLVSLFIVYFLSTITEGLIIDIILVVLGGIVYLLLLVPLRFYKEEDVRLLNMVSERFPRFKRYINFLIKFMKV
jgi:O-antigen/teichoic acid export membrane protein